MDTKIGSKVVLNQVGHNLFDKVCSSYDRQISPKLGDVGVIDRKTSDMYFVRFNNGDERYLYSQEFDIVDFEKTVKDAIIYLENALIILKGLK